MKKLLAFLEALSIALLAWVPFLDQNVAQNNPNVLIRNIATFILLYKFWIVSSCAVYIFIYTLFPKWVLPNKEKNRIKRNLLQRINRELLGHDFEKHRITLFRETCWFMAVIRNYWYLIVHLIFYREKWKLYKKFPRFGKYLIVDTRCGQYFKKSSTMFRIEENKPELCNGVAAYVRCKETSVAVQNLPNINDIDFIKINDIQEIQPLEKQEYVKRYMKEGFINSFVILRKMHHKAIHFYGTIITRKDGSPWGVLLVDSSCERSPFTKEIQKRINSFAISISDIINMEV